MSEWSDKSFAQIETVCRESIRRTFPDHIPLYAVSTTFLAAAVAVSVIYQLALPLSAALFFFITLINVGAIVSGVSALRHLLRLFRAKQTERPVAALCHQMIESALTGDRFGNFFHGLLVFTPLMVIFAALKTDIAHIHPFAWDEPLMKTGLMLGFGRHLWMLLQPIFGYPPITTFLSFVYGSWFFVMFGCLFWQMTSTKSDPLRAQFLLAYAFAWFFGGFVIATLFSSAGPAFYGYVARGPNPYAPLIQYLNQTSHHWPVWTVQVQQDLWQAYRTGTGDIEGISAMPSMHVTIATLLALFGWRISRKLGIVLTAFAMLVNLASILLAWHYVADCVAGAGLAVIFWCSAGRVVAAWSAYLQRRSARAPAALPAEI